MRDELDRIRSWAQDKLATCEEPPWAFFQYMKLVEAVTAILDGMASTTAHSPPAAGRSGTSLRTSVGRAASRYLSCQSAIRSNLAIPSLGIGGQWVASPLPRMNSRFLSCVG